MPQLEDSQARVLEVANAVAFEAEGEDETRLWHWAIAAERIRRMEIPMLGRLTK